SRHHPFDGFHRGVAPHVRLRPPQRRRRQRASQQRGECQAHAPAPIQSDRVSHRRYRHHDKPPFGSFNQTASEFVRRRSRWQRQRLRRDRLKTLDGQPVRVLHPGFWNHEAGPDFRGAVLQFACEKPRSGDVEIDLHPAGWHGHGHDRNPAYQEVILHVVWEADVIAGGALPTLALSSQLDSPLNELTAWLSHESDAPGLLAGQCSAPLRDLPENVMREVLRQAALVRLQRKASELAARARQVGWEQSLWEGLFAALGYKQNIWPMRRVAELLPVLRAGELKKRSAT